MAIYKVTDNDLISIANAIRAKTGKTANIEFPTEFITEIGDISGGVEILGGTSDPANSLGSNGDIYFKYLDFSDVPAIYKPLKSIQGTGTQNINTGYTPSIYTKLSMRMNPQYIGSSAVLGSDWSLNGFFLMFYNNAFRWHTATSVDVPAVVSKDYLIEVDNSGITVDGTKYTTTPSASVTQQPISLFTTTVNSQGGKGQYILYGVEIWESDTLERDMIPVKRVADSIIGLYDRVDGVFYTNSGTGSFVAGNEFNSSNPIINTYLKTGGVWLPVDECDWSDVII